MVACLHESREEPRDHVSECSEPLIESLIKWLHKWCENLSREEPRDH